MKRFVKRKGYTRTTYSCFSVVSDRFVPYETLFFVLVIEMFNTKSTRKFEFQTNEQHGHCLVQIRSKNLAVARMGAQLSHRC